MATTVATALIVRIRFRFEDIVSKCLNWLEREPRRDLRLPLRIRRGDLAEVVGERVRDDRAVHVEQQVRPVQGVEEVQAQLDLLAAANRYLLARAEVEV